MAQDLCLLQVNFADWMLFQKFILCERSALIKKPSLEIPKANHQHKHLKGQT